ncbi:MAG: 6,7-dimethyl-8-ribityllumazine synthase [Verrucomicrobiales bacterium]|nr:6,7-dimethyl-8-ribityllumazine synthase [Verrucomicrobiales bacterium]
MPKSAPDSVSPISFSGRIAIVASKYNSLYTDALVESASAKLKELCPESKTEVIRVPGAFEIPVVVEKLARDVDETPAAIIALGVIIRGSTAHADLIAESITHALHRTSLDHCIPVIHEVLLVESAEQAKDRTLGDELNRGREAAEAAVDMIQVMSTLS